MTGTPNQTAPHEVERFVQQLMIAYKAASLYPTTSAILAEYAEAAARPLAEACVRFGDIEFAVSKHGIQYAGQPLVESHAAVRAFALDLYHRSVAAIRFRGDTDARSLLALFDVVGESPEDVADEGGFATALWERGVDSITVVSATIKVIDEDDMAPPGSDDAETHPGHDDVARLIATARTPSASGHRVLVRMLMDPTAISRHVRAVHDQSAQGGSPHEPSAVVATIARIIDSLGAEERDAAMRAVAEATRSLPGGEVRAATAERLIVMARTDHAVEALVRHIGIEHMCRALVEGVAPARVSVAGLARAIGTLARINHAARDEMTSAVGAAMRAAGVSEPPVEALIGRAMPFRLEGDSAPGDRDGAVDEVLRLVGLSAGPATRAPEDPELDVLRAEAAAGLTDSDVTGALVTLAVLATGTEEFEQSLRLVEDSLTLLLERGEYEVAADTAETLLQTAESALPHERERLLEAATRLAGANEVRTVHRAMRLFEKDSAEHRACQRLLSVLGRAAIGPLLEMLAEEPDMTLRKSMVELISTVADQNIEELGRRITDSRWYFVRNVVSILGSTRRSESVPFLGRTLGHVDPRVRRESIRALAGVPDPRVPNLLETVLSDADDGNVQLAARYLGSQGQETSVPALVHVALGEGEGSREYGARSEAVAALGRIGSRQSLPALESLAGRRLLAGARGRDLAAAATAAIREIERTQEAAE